MAARQAEAARVAGIFYGDEPVDQPNAVRQGNVVYKKKGKGASDSCVSFKDEARNKYYGRVKNFFLYDDECFAVIEPLDVICDIKRSIGLPDNQVLADIVGSDDYITPFVEVQVMDSVLIVPCRMFLCHAVTIGVGDRLFACSIARHFKHS